MPEFAEVNIQVQYLRQRCLGWEVAQWGKEGWGHFKNLPEEGRDQALEDFWVGNVIEDITQRGKQVILRTRRGVVSAHLMFKGRWSVQGDPFISNYKQHKKAPTDKSRTFWIITPEGQRLNFHSPEYKAKVQAFPGEMDPGQIEHLNKLGPEILVLPETDPAFAQEPWTLEAFTKKAARSKQAIKAFLLDQKRQSGLGNMYVCEALYDAGVAPTRPAKSLSDAELAALHRASGDILRRALETQLDYDALLRIYRREADPQGRAVECTKVSGRDTFWVPEAQS
jgi:formamidopyrimidine-DNA glycosylase